MRNIIIVVVIFFLCIVSMSVETVAQQARNVRSQGRGGGQLLSRMYNPQTVVSEKGTVNKIEKMQYGRGRYYGLHIILKTETEMLSVHLGPAWFIEGKTKIDEGDSLEVKGSQIVYNNTPTIIASQLINGDQILQLRDEVGVPVWSRSGIGRRRRQN